MNFSQSFRLAIKSLMASKMRALLTMLGIIIGVAAVIIITSLGNGIKELMNSQFEQLGANMIQVQLFGAGRSSRDITPNDMYDLVDEYPEYLSGVSPYVPVQVIVRNGSEEYTRTSIYGVSEFFYDNERNQTITGNIVEEGRFLTYVDVERYQNVCVIGSHLAKEAFGGDAMGKKLTLQGSSFTIVGVLEEQSDSSEGSMDDVIFIPYGNALRLNNSSTVFLYLFNSVTQESAPIAKNLIDNFLYDTYLSSYFYMVVSSAEMMDAMSTMMDTTMTVLVAIAAISLLVGGIGIMNIMLVSVSERTREIGIRKSLGAKRRDIRGQFIIEAATTSAIGGVLGIGLGVMTAGLAGTLVTTVTGIPFAATPSVGSVAVAFGVSVGIGIIFGYLPANKAASLNPIDALRYD